MEEKENEKVKRGFWRNRFRITIQEESTFRERRAYLLSGRRMSGVVGGLGLSVVLITYFLVAHTPLTEYVVPGYVANQYREDASIARAQADSALAALESQGGYIENLKIILSGGVPDSTAVEPGMSAPAPDADLPPAGNSDLELRDRIESEDRFALNSSGPNNTVGMGFDFPPVAGGVSDSFNMAQGHLGIDLIGAEGDMIYSVDDGTVIEATFTAENGYIIIVQHSNNRMSVYKHASSLLKYVGEVVKAGDPIAQVGSAGTLSTGPHLHFEWWVNGRAVDPSPWLVQ